MREGPAGSSQVVPRWMKEAKGLLKKAKEQLANAKIRAVDAEQLIMEEEELLAGVELGYLE